MKVYQALYNHMIYESDYVTLSLHETKEGALRKIAEHKSEKQDEFNRIYKDIEPPIEFGEFEDWTISEIEVEK